MNFCDKLQKIRKENNITQEQLADKLNVSRQAVSKWESGTAYPDTEKLIQISKLFKVSLDDLINDKNDITKNSDKKKFNFMETFDMIFESIRKVFSMFFAMKFWEKVKFLLEMAFVVLAIYLAASLINTVILSIIRRIFAFLPYKIYNVIDYFVYTILYIVWLILGVMFFIRVLKIRYLDYYVIVKDDSIDTPVVEEPIKELKANKETKIVIRDPAHSGSAFFAGIAKAIVFLFKCFCIILLIPIVVTFVALICLLVISLIYLFGGLFFNGISIAIIGGIFFTYLLIKFIYNVIFNQKLNYLKMFIIFIASISLMGIGVGLSFASLSSFETYNGVEDEKITTILDVKMKDNFTMEEIVKASDDKIVIDDNLKDIKIDVLSNKNYIPYIYTYHMYDPEYENNVEMSMVLVDENEFEIIKNFAEDIKKKRINQNGYGSDYEIDKIYISRDNLNKLKDVYKKLDD